MLSLTYTLNALKIEQNRVREYLHALIQNIDNKCACSSPCSPNDFEQLLHQIKLVHLHSSWRRLEVHVLPEISDASECMALLLAELDSIRLLGLELYRSSRDQLRAAIEGKQTDMQVLMQTMRLYCSTLQELLEKEERLLFNEAFAFVEEDKWFSVAQRFMQIDKEMIECEKVGEVKCRHHSKPVPWSTFGFKSDMELVPFLADKLEPLALAVCQDRAVNRPLPRLAS